MKKTNIFVTAIMLAFASSSGAMAQTITGGSAHSPAAGGARILEVQGNTPANPAIGFHSTASTPGNPQNDGGGGNGIFRPVANEMGFATGSKERLRITSGGTVGIGTSLPTAALHLLTGTNSGMLPPVFKLDRMDGTNQAGLLSIGVSSNGFATGLLGGGSAYFKLEDPYGNSKNRDMGFSTNGNAAQFVIKNNGFVGIGTETPSANFHSIGTARLESLPSSVVNTMVISTDANGNLSYQPASSLFPSSTSWLLGGNLGTTAADYIGTGDANPFKIHTSAIERARFTPTGEMGIGTTSPTAKLDVTAIGSLMDVGIKSVGINTGVYGEASVMNAPLTAEGTIAGWTEAVGVFGNGNYVSNLSNGNIFGVVGSATANTNPLNNVGVYGEAKNASGYNTGVYGGVTYGLDFGGVPPTKGIYNSGVAGKVELNTSAIWNRAINGMAPVAPNHYAGYFDGNVDMQSGTVRIGNVTTPVGYKLYVEKGILTEKVKVAIAGTPAWADYVFANDYKLKPLAEVEAFVKIYKHLPNIPSATELVKDGLNLGEMQAKQMGKIEELTLYMIEMKKEIDALKKQNNNLRGQISKN